DRRCCDHRDGRARQLADQHVQHREQPAQHGEREGSELITAEVRSRTARGGRETCRPFRLRETSGACPYCLTRVGQLDVRMTIFTFWPGVSVSLAPSPLSTRKRASCALVKAIRLASDCTVSPRCTVTTSIRRGVIADASLALIRRIDWNIWLKTLARPAGVIAAK